MTINPAGVLLLVLGIAAIIVGVTGSQSTAWAAIFGGGVKTASATTASPGTAVTLDAAHPMSTTTQHAAGAGAP